jgi:hypothetical protein
MTTSRARSLLEVHFSVFRVVALTLVMLGIVNAGAGVVAHVEEPARLAWSGGEEFATPAIIVTGPWTVTLAAWCHEGTSHVRVAVLDADGDEVDSLTVFGQGVQSAELEVGPGVYALEVTSPTMIDYTWELLVEGSVALGEEVGEDDRDEHSDVSGALVAELPTSWASGEEFTSEVFAVAGPIEVTVAAWCHEGVSYVRLEIVDEHGEVVAEVTVWGQGVITEKLNLDPGPYRFRVASPDMDEYVWELAIRPADDSDDASGP